MSGGYIIITWMLLNLHTARYDGFQTRADCRAFLAGLVQSEVVTTHRGVVTQRERDHVPLVACKRKLTHADVRLVDAFDAAGRQRWGRLTTSALYASDRTPRPAGTESR